MYRVNKVNKDDDDDKTYLHRLKHRLLGGVVTKCKQMFDVNITFPFEAILLPVKAETGINAIFTSGVPLSLEYERLSIVVA